MRTWKPLLPLLLTGALALSGMAGVSQDPGAGPASSVDIGHGMVLLDRSAGKALVAPDNELPGGRRLKLRWAEWRVTVQPTGRAEFLASQTCARPCAGGKHEHPKECKVGEGGCAAACSRSSHATSFSPPVMPDVSKSISLAVSRAKEAANALTAGLGLEGMGIELGSASGSDGGRTITGAVSLAMAQASTGAMRVDPGHFFTGCCGEETLWFGAREFEVRLSLQVLEQDYSSGAWSAGAGGAGALPLGPLALVGEVKRLGSPRDVSVGTYQVLSQQPLAKRFRLDCLCEPEGERSEGDDEEERPKITQGTPRFVVTAGPRERVFFHNPTTSQLKVHYAFLDFDMDPGETIEIPREIEDENEESPRGPQTAGGTVGPESGPLFYGYVVDWEGKAQRIEEGGGSWFKGPKPPVIAAAKPQAEAKFGKLTAPVPKTPDPTEEPMSPNPREGYRIESTLVGGLATSSLVFLGEGRLQTVEIRGLLPEGATFALTDGAKRFPAHVFTTVQDLTGQTRSAFMQFAGVADLRDCRLAAFDDQGKEVASIPIRLGRAVISMTAAPKTGRAGSAATLTVDCNRLIAAMAMEGMDAMAEYELALDYTKSGGATGPARAAIGPDGLARIPIKRGTRQGGFEVGVQLVPRRER